VIRVLKILTLMAVLLAVVSTAAAAKGENHPECSGLPASPGHEKHKDEHCGTLALDTRIVSGPEEGGEYSTTNVLRFVLATTPEGLNVQWRAYYFEGDLYTDWAGVEGGTEANPFLLAHGEGTYRIEFRAVDGTRVDETPATVTYHVSS
jgi:hypothetical protein